MLERWPSARFRIIIEFWVKKQTPEYLNLVGVSSSGDRATMFPSAQCGRKFHVVAQHEDPSINI